MTRLMIARAVAVTLVAFALGSETETFAQARPDFSGRALLWQD